MFVQLHRAILCAKVVIIFQSNKKWRLLLSPSHLSIYFYLLVRWLEGKGGYLHRGEHLYFRRTAAVESRGLCEATPIWSDFSAFAVLYSNKGTIAGTNWNTPCFFSVLSNVLLILANNFSNQQSRYPLIALWRDCAVCEGWIVVARRWVEASIRNRRLFSNLSQREVAADR